MPNAPCVRPRAAPFYGIMQPGHRRKLKRFDIAGHGRCLTFSCHRRLPLLGNERIRDALVDHLAFVKDELDFRLLAWVVMPEHVHLLLIPGRASVTAILRGIKAPLAQRVLARWRQLDAPILARLIDARGVHRFWQRGGGYDRNVTTERAMSESIGYIHANPVRRGLVTRPTDWRWSSARWYAGQRDGGPGIDGLT